MPRSLTELGRAMPDVSLVPYPVLPQAFRKERWWQRSRQRRACCFSEYVKFLPSAARFGVARVLTALDGSAVAGHAALRASTGRGTLR